MYAHRHAARRTGTGTAAPDRRAVHPSPVLRQPQDGVIPAHTGPSGEPQSRATADAHPGAVGHGTGAQHQTPAPAAQNLSLPVARCGGGLAESGVEHRHHLHPAGAVVRGAIPPYSIAAGVPARVIKSRKESVSS